MESFVFANKVAELRTHTIGHGKQHDGVVYTRNVSTDCSVAKSQTS